MASGTTGGSESGGDKVKVVESSTPAPVVSMTNSPPNAIPLPQDSTAVAVGTTNNDNKPGKNMHIAINFSGVELGAVNSEGVESVQVSFSFGFSNLKGQSFKVDCTTSVPISSGGTSAAGSGSGQGRISSGGGGKTH